MLHLHLIYRGKYIPRDDKACRRRSHDSCLHLADAWKEIMGDSYRTWLQEQHNTNKAIDYLMKYITKQSETGEGESYSWSQNWVYQGFVKDWSIWRRLYGKDAVKKWKEYMRGAMTLKVAAIPFECNGRFVYRDWTKALDKSLGRFKQEKDGHIDG